MDITIPWWTGKIKLHQGDFVNSVQYLLLIPTQASLKLSFLVCPSIKMRLSYTAWVGSQDVFKAGRALNNSKTYSTDEVREMSVGKSIGQSEIIEHRLGWKEKMKKWLINSWQATDTVGDPDTTCVSNVAAMTSSTLSEFEKNPLECLTKKKISNGCITVLLELDKFR